MAHYKKYTLLYYFHKKDLASKQYIRLIYLGTSKNPKAVPLLDGAYAYKTFSSKLDICELSKNFFESLENVNSICNYIGKEYSIDEYFVLHPDFDTKKLIGSTSSYKIAETFPLGLTFVKTFSIFAPTRVISLDDALKETTLITLETLLAEYESVLLF